MAELIPSLSGRRSFLARVSAGAAAFAATLATGAAAAQAQTPGSGGWRPARHEKDDWLDQLPGKHRVVFDTTASDALGEALAFAGNFIRVNRTEYDLQSSDLAILVIARHRSSGLALNDRMWEKYGQQLSARTQFIDPKTKEPPASNLFNSTEYGSLLSNRGNTLDKLLQQGVQFAVCGVATRGVAGAIAEATGQKTDDVFAELGANLISSSQARLVTAGIVAVNRAQERGYSLVTT